MAQTPLSAVGQSLRGIGIALRARVGILLAATAAVAVFNLVAPIAILSIARRPPDFATFNPWLTRLPDYLRSEEPLGKKVEFLSHMAIGWISADNKVEGIDWGFIIDVPTLARIALTSLIFGAFFALWSYLGREGQACGIAFQASRPAGVAGALTSVFGLTAGPCTLAGCGVPVLPVLGLAFTGLSSGTMTLFATISRVAIAAVLAGMTAGMFWLGWRVGGLPRSD